MALFTHLREDYRSHREGLLSQGFWALTFYRFGYARKRVRWRVVRVPWAIAYVFLSKLSQMLFGIQSGMDTQIGRRFVIEHFGGIIIHNNAIIGDDVVVRQGVTIGNRSLDRPLEAPRIGDRVNIGANAVVLCDVPSGHLAAGVPAIVKPRKGFTPKPPDFA